MQHTLRSFSRQVATVGTLQLISPEMDLSGMMFCRYYFARCPREWECSDRSWDRVKSCESFQSESEARTLLHQHLTKSGRHNFNDHWKLWQSIEEAEMIKDEMPGEWFDEAPGSAVGDAQVDSPLLFDSMHW